MALLRCFGCSKRGKQIGNYEVNSLSLRGKRVLSRVALRAFGLMGYIGSQFPLAIGVGMNNCFTVENRCRPPFFSFFHSNTGRLTHAIKTAYYRSLDWTKSIVYWLFCGHEKNAIQEVANKDGCETSKARSSWFSP